MDFQFSRFEIITGTGALFLCLVFVCLFMEASDIQTEITTAALAAVEHEDLYWVGVEGRGQSVLLTGTAPDAAAIESAEATVANVVGVTSVDNRIVAIGDAGRCQRRMDDYLRDRRVTFKAGRAELAGASFTVLNGVAAIARACGAAFEVATHTDAQGDSAINAKLSQRRADVVVRYLAQSGVPAERLRAAGYGESQPVADNSTETGRAANNRVEFRVLGEEA